MKSRLVILFALLAVPAMALAAGYEGHFGDMDSDKNDQVTWQEFQTHFSKAAEDDFLQAAGYDRILNHEEWHGFKESMGFGHGREDGAGQAANQGHMGAKHMQSGSGYGHGMGKVGDGTTLFEALDEDKDGRLNRDEIAKGAPGMSAVEFGAADSSKDGFLDHNEWASCRTRMGFGKGYAQ